MYPIHMKTQPGVSPPLSGSRGGCCLRRSFPREGLPHRGDAGHVGCGSFPSLRPLFYMPAIFQISIQLFHAAFFETRLFEFCFAVLLSEHSGTFRDIMRMP